LRAARSAAGRAGARVRPRDARPDGVRGNGREDFGTKRQEEARGKLTRKVAPRNGSESTVSVAPKCSRMVVTNDSPSPLPVVLPAYRALSRFVLKRGSAHRRR